MALLNTFSSLELSQTLLQVMRKTYTTQRGKEAVLATGAKMSEVVSGNLDPLPQQPASKRKANELPSSGDTMERANARAIVRSCICSRGKAAFCSWKFGSTDLFLPNVLPYTANGPFRLTANG